MSDHFRWPFEWTDARVALLRELWTKGKSGGEIAALLGGGVSRSAVIGKVHRLKLPKRGEAGRVLEGRRNQIRRAHRRVSTQRFGERKTAHVAAAQANRPARLPLPPPQAPTASAVKFEALEPHHCRWVHDTPEGRVFCGCDVVPGKSWCKGHLLRVYREFDPIPVKRRQNPQRQITFYDRERENA